MKYKEIANNKEINAYLQKGNANLGQLGFTDHSKAHCVQVAHQAGKILKRLGYSEHEIELAKIAGYMHDIGNAINRTHHAEYGALLANDLLKETDMSLEDRITVIAAIGNHDESTGSPEDVVSAALIIADKTDVRRSRVRQKEQSAYDIHDRVNYAVTDAKGNEVKGFKVTEENLASAVSTYAASYTQTNKLVITYPKDAENTEYTLTVSDKSNKYAPITTTFELYADAVSAAYNNDATAPKLVVADGASAAQFADFIGKIKSVNVNGKDYPATGKGAVKLIKEDGTIDTTQAPFAEGSSFEIKVSATGYKDELSFTYEKPAVIETKALESVIEKADTLKEADYTADSWKTFSQVLSSAKAVLKQKDDQTKIDNAVASLNKAIEGLKKKEAVNPGTPGSGAGSSNGTGTNATVATGSKSNSTTTDTTGTAAKKATVKKASKTGDTNPLMGMLALAFASISLVGAALFAKKPNRK